MQKSVRDKSEKKDENEVNRQSRLKILAEHIKERLAEKGEREVRERLRRTVGFAIIAAAVYLLCGAELFFGTFPLCLGLICSSRRHLPAVAAGIVLAVFGGLPATYVYTCLALLLTRVLYVFVPAVFAELSGIDKEESRELIKYKSDAVDKAAPTDEKEESVIAVCLKKLFCEDLHVKLLIAAIGGALCGFLILTENDFSFYGLCAMSVLTFLAPISVAALGGIFGEERYIKNTYRIFSFGAIFLLVILGSEGGSVLGMPLTPMLAMLLTLYVSSGSGVIYGIATAIICGVIFDLLYVPLLALSAIVFCIVSAVRRNAGVAAVCALIVIWCYYIGGEGGLVSVLPPMLLAIPIYMIADKYREMMQAPFRSAMVADGLYFAEAMTEKTKNEAVRERLSTLSETFASLSENIYKLSDRFRRPDVLGIRELTDSAFEGVCEGCRNKDRCWGAEYSNTLEAVRRVSAALHTKGNVEKADLTDGFVAECVRCDRLINAINSTVSKTTERIINGGKANFFAANYDDITAILTDALKSDSEEYECDVEAGVKICEYLYSQGFDVGGIVVYGKRCRHVVGKRVSLRGEISAEKNREIGRKISEIVGADMSDPVFEVGKDGNTMLMYSKPKIHAGCAHGRLSRAGKEWSSSQKEEDSLLEGLFDIEDACGDMTDAFITDSSYFYSLISDGMGSGPSAAYTSEVCAMFIEKMLTAGNRADITLRMLNNVIRSENMGCGDECSATVDLLELDLMSGTAAFIKSGAAPTYIAREGTVYKISSRTMPVGIIKDADARITRFDTQKGDIIVMMSDGCCHDSEDCPWLVEYLCSYMKQNRKTVTVGDEVCERIKADVLHEAVKNVPRGVERDDISVSVIVVG